MGKYRWANPHEWLEWALNDMENAEVLETAQVLASLVDSEDIFRNFEPEMTADDYFKDLSTVEGTITVTIADHPGQVFPDGLGPGTFDLEDLVEMLRHHKNNPAAIEFLADAMRPTDETILQTATASGDTGETNGAGVKGDEDAL